MDFPVPVEPQHAVNICVTPSPPSDAGLSPSLASRQKGTDLHLQIVAHFAEGTTGIADPEVADPAGHGCVDAVDNHRHGGGAPAPDDVPYLGPPAAWEQLDEAARIAALGVLARIIARMLVDAPAKETGNE